MPSLNVRISGSVGRGAVNQPTDVIAIQQLINANLPIPLRPLRVDGRCGPLTISAIEEIQRRNLQINPPDGRIDIGGATFRFLTGGAVPVNPASTPASKPHHPHAAAADGRFPEELIAAAQDAEKTWKIPASVTLAQWALESNWGKAMPQHSNNPFGIKAAAGQAYVEARTREVINGKDVVIVAKFRKFASVSEAFSEHGKLLATGTPYTKARTHLDDPDRFADALTGVYATDPNYGTVLKKLMGRYNLYQYN